MRVERRLNDAALNSSSAAVDEADFPQACFARGNDVFVDNRTDLTRLKRVEVDLGVNGETVHQEFSRPFSLSFSRRLGPHPQALRARGLGFASLPSGRSRGPQALFLFYFAYVAVTVVLMPPRTEKSPTTVMRRGAHAATRSSRIWLVTAS